MVKYHKKWYKKNKNRIRSDKYTFTNNYPASFLNSEFMKTFDIDSKLKFMEIGAQEGHNCIKLVNNFLKNKDSRLYCLELFPEDKFGMEENFDHNISLLKEDAEKIIKMSGPSYKSLRELSCHEHMETFDLIYMDGWHGAHGVIDDLVLSWKLLKVGGIVVLDDYLWGSDMKEFRRPKIAIDSFWKMYSIFGEKFECGNNQRGFKKTISSDSEVEICIKKSENKQEDDSCFVYMDE